MTGKLICPLLLPVSEDKVRTPYCLKENCAFWVEEAGYCSFNAISWAIGDINHQLSKLAEILLVISREMKRSR